MDTLARYCARCVRSEKCLCDCLDAGCFFPFFFLNRGEEDEFLGVLQRRCNVAEWWSSAKLSLCEVLFSYCRMGGVRDTFYHVLQC